jgi:UTP--glucose-1-phosphate uridylyltransferase
VRSAHERYGIIGTGGEEGDAFCITALVEACWLRRRRIHINGRYIFQPEIFDHLARFERGAGGEIQLTDAMRALSASQPFHGWRFPGRTFDCGSSLGFLAANIAWALDRPDIAPGLRAELDGLLGKRR